MSLFASQIGTVPAQGFDWYIILLEGPFADAIREQIHNYFLTLGREAGPRVLAVRGYDSTRFRESFIEAASFYGEEDWKNIDLPAIVVTDAVPSAVKKRDGLKDAKVMVFSLRPIYEKHKDVSRFFERLLAALQQSEASKALEGLEEGKVEKYWGWLSDYVEITPSFCGFKFDIGKLVGALAARKVAQR